MKDEFTLDWINYVDEFQESDHYEEWLKYMTDDIQLLNTIEEETWSERLKRNFGGSI